MKRRAIAAILTAAMLATLALSASAQGAFNVESFDVAYENEDGSPARQAGSHPFAMTTTIQFATRPDPKNPAKLTSDGALKDLQVTLPAGLVGDRNAVKFCPDADFLLVDVTHQFSACPLESVVGVLRVRSPGDFSSGGDPSPAFLLDPPPGVAAKIGFVLLHVPVALLIRVNPENPHNLIGTIKNTANIEPIGGSTLTVWGDPSAAAHDDERGDCVGGGACPVPRLNRALLTLPRSCEGPLFSTYAANSWEEPATTVSGASQTPLETEGCAKLGFDPTVSGQPTTHSAESASGLAFDIDVNDKGLTDPAGEAMSDMKRTVVTLPEGVTVNPSAANGLEACSPQAFARETLASQPGEGCPQASKLGSMEIETPLLQGSVIPAQVYLAAQDDPDQPGAENPFNAMTAIYLVIKDPETGIIVKLAAKVDLNEKTGQLTTTFGEGGQEIPQFPVSHVRFRFREGPRAPLITPPNCATYTANAAFQTWAAPFAPIPRSAQFQITAGIGGGPCPSGTPPFKPGFTAGSTNPLAGAYSPFNARITRNDGEQEGTRFDAILPPGVVAKLAGVPKCPDAAAAAAKAKSGRQELASPSCPAGSLIGHTLGGAGVGDVLTYVPGSLYLGGPLGGDPFSIIAITPAVAGPFDAGTVVVRQALTLDPVTGEGIVDGSHSDPIPHILKGIPLKLRDLRVYVDRPNFALNPTSCEPLSTRATIFGSSLDALNPGDDVGVGATSPYQASDCAALKFKPKLSLKLKGGTKRNDHPSLRSLLTYPKGAGYANVGKAVVKLPPSEFIDNAHIQNPCTRVQFNAHSCPKGSILGTAKAETPLLDKPLEGPVYFRSNGGERLLPDIVADLNGEVHIILVGKVDSRKGRIRTTFDQVPDAPVSKFSLNLYGGKRGLLVNSRNLCAHPLKADVRMSGQNGTPYNTRPVIGTSCKKKGKKGGGKGTKRG